MLAPERRSRWWLRARLVLGALLQPAIFTVLLFGPAPTFVWWRAWVVIGVVAVASAVSLVALARDDPDLLDERFKPPLQRGQPLADRIVVLLFLASFLATILLVPIDVFRLRLLPPPPPWLAAVGLGLFLGGWWLTVRAMRENTFAAPVVRHQTERRHHVVDTGPYAVVRHPMYVGGALLLIGLPLWLESTAAVLAAGIPIAILVVRIAIEERFLRRELAGYEGYSARVRSRLIPGVW